MQRPAGGMIRVYLLDDHDIVRQGLRDLLSLRRDLVVAGESGSARTAIRSIAKLKPDVMLLDLHLQDGTGLEVCRTVRAEEPSIRGLLLTAAGTDEAMMSTLLAGADGFVEKLARGDAVVEAIRQVAAGAVVLDVDQDAERTRLRSELETVGSALEPRLRSLADDALRGLTNTEITSRSGLSATE